MNIPDRPEIETCQLTWEIVDSNIPSDLSSVDTNSSKHLRNVQLTDVVMNEFDNRFTDNSVDLWTSMETSHPKSKMFLESTSLMPQNEYTNTIPVISRYINQRNIDSEVLRAQCNVHKNLII